MSTNLYKRLRALIPEPPVQAGEVTALLPEARARVQLYGSSADAAHLVVRNPTGQPVGGAVYVQDGQIIGPAPVLPYELIEV